jgi:hypothetical protein
LKKVVKTVNRVAKKIKFIMSHLPGLLPAINQAKQIKSCSTACRQRQEEHLVQSSQQHQQIPLQVTHSMGVGSTPLIFDTFSSDKMQPLQARTIAHTHTQIPPSSFLFHCRPSKYMKSGWRLV